MEKFGDLFLCVPPQTDRSDWNQVVIENMKTSVLFVLRLSVVALPSVKTTRFGEIYKCSLRP